MIRLSTKILVEANFNFIKYHKPEPRSALVSKFYNINIKETTRGTFRGVWNDVLVFTVRVSAFNSMPQYQVEFYFPISETAFRERLGVYSKGTFSPDSKIPFMYYSILSGFTQNMFLAAADVVYAAVFALV